VKKFQDRQVFLTFTVFNFVGKTLASAFAEIDSNIFDLNGQLIFIDYSHRSFLCFCVFEPFYSYNQIEKPTNLKYFIS